MISLQVKKTPFTLMASVFCQLSMGKSCTGTVAPVMPAELIRMSIRPSVSYASFAARATAA